ncbi:MAG: hypothetical protein R2747_19000 [Pyrinomonadaceae bacterium]
MKKNEKTKISSQPKFEDSDGRKEYQKPELKIYGGIAELVLALGGAGADGSGFPPVSLT